MQVFGGAVPSRLVNSYRRNSVLDCSTLKTKTDTYFRNVGNRLPVNTT